MGLIADIFGKRPKVPSFKPTDIEAEQRKTVSQNQAIFPESSKLASSVNLFNVDQSRALSERMLPGLLSQSIANTSSQLRGELTPEIINQNQRLSAASALSLGLGGTQFQSGLEGGRNLISALQLQQQGQQNFQALQGLMPKQFGAESMFFSPQERLSFTYQQNMDKWNRDWLKNQVKAQPTGWGQFLQDTTKLIIGGLAGAGGKALGGAM
jgi:hypothetical protein